MSLSDFMSDHSAQRYSFPVGSLYHCFHFTANKKYSTQDLHKISVYKKIHFFICIKYKGILHLPPNYTKELIAYE